MSKLLLVSDDHTPDQLLMIVPDDYAEEDVLERCSKMDMTECEIHEMILPEHFTADLRDLGIHPWRENWG